MMTNPTVVAMAAPPSPPAALTGRADVGGIAGGAGGRGDIRGMQSAALKVVSTVGEKTRSGAPTTICVLTSTMIR